MDKQGSRRMVLVLGLMAFWCNGDNYAAAPLLVEIARDLHLDISRAAFSVAAYMLPFGLFTLLFGPLADRYGKARIINLAAFGTAVFSALGAVAFDLASLSLIRAVNGAFAAAIFSGIASAAIPERSKTPWEKSWVWRSWVGPRLRPSAASWRMPAPGDWSTWFMALPNSSSLLSC